MRVLIYSTLLSIALALLATSEHGLCPQRKDPRPEELRRRKPRERPVHHHYDHGDHR